MRLCALARVCACVCGMCAAAAAVARARTTTTALIQPKEEGRGAAVGTPPKEDGATRQERRRLPVARNTMSNPLPSDVGAVFVLDQGADEPRPRRPDEATEAGEAEEQDYFIVHPGIGVSVQELENEQTERASSDGVQYRMLLACNAMAMESRSRCLARRSYTVRA